MKGRPVALLNCYITEFTTNRVIIARGGTHPQGVTLGAPQRARQEEAQIVVIRGDDSQIVRIQIVETAETKSAIINVKRMTVYQRLELNTLI